MMRFCSPQYQNQIVVDDIVFGAFRLHLHAADHFTQWGVHIRHDNWAVPIEFRAGRHCIEEEIAQEMVCVQYE